jgi:hypothetical protein
VREDELLRLLLAGHMMKECAVHVQLSYKTVRDYAREPKFLERLRELSAEVYERVDAELKNSKDTIVSRLEQMSENALEEMYTMALALPHGVTKMKALQDILDRDTRVSRQRKVEATTAHSFVDPLFLIHAAGSARELEMKQLGTGEVVPSDKPPEGTT